MNHSKVLRAPFPWFGGKRSVVADVWQRLGRPKQYVEPFCGSAAVLLGAPAPASLEVIGDLNGFVANFWRCAKYQPEAVADAADYPVSHIDLHARLGWLMRRRDVLADGLADPEWKGDAQAAGWWLWGQCSWIGGGWCEWAGEVPHVSDAGRGIKTTGKVPHVSDAGRGIQAAGRVPHINNAGMGMLTSGGEAALVAMRQLCSRLDRVRIIHGSWDRTVNHHYGGDRTALFFDPPYLAYESLYGTGGEPVALQVEAWCKEHEHLRIALCGHSGDYKTLDGWSQLAWSREGNTYGGNATKDAECIWFSPPCEAGREQLGLFGGEP